MKLLKFLLSLCLLSSPFMLRAGSFTIEAESMTLGGPYAGLRSTPFQGIALYGNSDKGTTTHAFPDGMGIYNVSITGASNNSSGAGVSLYVNDVKLKAFTFYGTSASTQEATVKISSGPFPATIVLLLETDNGSSDTFVDKITFSYQGAVVTKTPPVLPATGAYDSGEYRNMLAECGFTDNQIGQKLDLIWNRLFYGDATTQTVYYPVGDDEAYILDTGNNDVRSEGMSYGMMICVQMDKQTEFNRLWKWAKTKMQHQSGARKGYFAWQVNTDGTVRDANTASDGEEYFIMALMFAANRWGNGEGIFNYWKEANDILQICMNKETSLQESIYNMFNSTHKQVVFTPFAQAASYTDPSYHLPAFYELWGKWADTNRPFWREVAAKSREMFSKFAHPQTGLMPDYANFDGTPTGGSHADFRFDAWRCVMNMAVDYAWFKGSDNEVAIINRAHNFFESKGIDSYGSEFSLAGNQLSADHSPGLVACNAAGALASNQAVAWEFIEDFFRIDVPSGSYRYYDGLLYFMNYLHLSGNFRIYHPATLPVDPNPEEPDPNDPDPIPSPEGYYIIENFDRHELDKSFKIVAKENTLSATASALVAADPADATNKAMHVYTDNYGEFLRLEVKLPSGRTLADYEQLEFDVYYNSVSGSDNGHKTLQYSINNAAGVSVDNTGGTDSHFVWKNLKCSLTGLSTDNAFTLDFGYRSAKANFYMDNIMLKEKPGLPTSLSDGETKPYRVTPEMIDIADAFAEVAIVCDMSGSVLLRQHCVTAIDIRILPPGVYCAMLLIGGKNYVCKIVK